MRPAFAPLATPVSKGCSRSPVDLSRNALLNGTTCYLLLAEYMLLRHESSMCGQLLLAIAPVVENDFPGRFFERGSRKVSLWFLKRGVATPANLLRRGGVLYKSVLRASPYPPCARRS